MSRTRSSRGALLLITLSFAGLSGARGEPSRAQLAEADAHAQRGAARLNAHDYDQAIREYDAGFLVLPLPGFLFNLGQAHRLKGSREQAIYYYGCYLDAAPDGSASQEARSHLKSLKRQTKGGARSPAAACPPGMESAPPAIAPAPPLEVAPPSSPPGEAALRDAPPPLARRPLFWGLLGGGAALVIAGLSVGIVLGTAERDPTASQQVTFTGGR